MSEEKSQHGGKRKGSGRKRLSNEQNTVIYTIRVPESLATSLRALGPDAVRSQLQKLANRRSTSKKTNLKK